MTIHNSITREDNPPLDMSLKDYPPLLNQFWEGKSSKSLKERSAFEPYRYTSYRPYLMGYRDHNYGEFGRRDCMDKYKIHPPHCDQCKYDELKRKSTSSLENIVLKLKKSRNDDDDIPRRIHDIEKLQDNVSHFAHHTPTFSGYSHCSVGFPHCSKCECDKSKERDHYLEKYSDEVKRVTSERYPEMPEESEKSSFVALLEQKDELNRRDPFPIASSSYPIDDKRDDTTRIANSYPIEEKRDDSTRIVNSSPIDESKDEIIHVTSNDENEEAQTSINVETTVDVEKLPDCTNMSDDADKISETKCDKCNKRFYRKSQLIRHLSNHVVHECHKCNAFFYCVRKFKKHLTTHESYPCEFCDQEFYEASAWYKHRAKHTMVECTSCDMIFYNKTALLKHRFAHLQYICPVCRYPFSNLNHWISHRSCHKTFGSTLLTPLFTCQECTTAFPSQDTYMKHVCLHRSKKSINIKGSAISKKEIADLIGVDRTAKR